MTQEELVLDALMHLQLLDKAYKPLNSIQEYIADTYNEHVAQWNIRMVLATMEERERIQP